MRNVHDADSTEEDLWQGLEERLYDKVSVEIKRADYENIRIGRQMRNFQEEKKLPCRSCSCSGPTDFCSNH